MIKYLLSLARLLHAALQRLVSTFIVRMNVLAIVDDTQSAIGDKDSRAFVRRVQSTLPRDSIGASIHAVIDVTVLRQDVQLQSPFRLLS